MSTRITLQDLSPVACGLLPSVIQTQAQQTYDKLGLSTTDLENALLSLGGRVVRTDHLLFSLVVLCPNDFTIYVRAGGGAFSTRYATAVNLGYRFVHYPLMNSDVMLVHRDIDQKVAIEARLFADALLMPPTLMHKLHKTTNGIVCDIADHLGLDIQIVRARLRQLELSH